MPNVITDLLGKATVINLMYLWVVFFFFLVKHLVQYSIGKY